MGDSQDVFHLVDRNRDRLGEWLPWVKNTNKVEDSMKFVEKSIEEFEKGNRFEYGLYLIEQENDKDRTKGNLIGAVGLVSVENDEAEIGYWLSKQGEGKGFMVTAVKELINASQQVLGLTKFVIKTVENNLKSRRIPEKLGFAETGLSEEQIMLDDVPKKLTVYQLILNQD